jgi:ketosteroid isomerase-like protein
MDTIAPEQVRQGVRKFWEIMSGKSADRLEDLYSPAAIVITGKGRQPETANMALARRTRQIGDSAQDLNAELGELEIQIVGDVAVATYTYQFHTTRTTAEGSLKQRHTLYGRATQIFQLDTRRGLKIVHEHLSSAANPKVDASGSFPPVRTIPRS